MYEQMCVWLRVWVNNSFFFLLLFLDFSSFLACGYLLRRWGLAPQWWQPSLGKNKNITRTLITQVCFSISPTFTFILPCKLRSLLEQLTKHSKTKRSNHLFQLLSAENSLPFYNLDITFISTFTVQILLLCTSRNLLRNVHTQ